MYKLFLLDGFYCVAKEVNNAWVVRLKTRSKLEAELFKVRMNRPKIRVNVESLMEGVIGGAMTRDKAWWLGEQSKWIGSREALPSSRGALGGPY